MKRLEERFVILVVVEGYRWDRKLLQLAPMRSKEAIVRVTRMPLHMLIQVVGNRWGCHIQRHNEPKVEESDVLCHESVAKFF